MSKKAQAGWGFGGSKDQAKIDLSNQVKDKVNIWEQTNEDLILIPDMDQEQKEREEYAVSAPGQQGQTKVQDLSLIDNMTQMTTLPQTEEDVDLSYLMSVLRPVEEIRENDEQWEFIKLKTDIYELVTQMYKKHNYNEEEDEDTEEEEENNNNKNQQQKRPSRQM